MIRKRNVVNLGIGLFCLAFLYAADEPSVQAMSAYEKQYEVLMQNVVNANTPGYRGSQVVVSNDGDKIVADALPFAERRGALIYSGNPYHVAIDGPGFFSVRGPQGHTIYTRDGRFVLNGEMQLVTLSGGLLVLGEGGPITVQLGAGGTPKIAVSDQGYVQVNGSSVGRFLVVEFTDYKKLVSINGSFFMSSDPENKPVPMDSFRVHQYYYEGSNINIADEIVNMPNISKKYDANSKVIQTMKKMRTTGREMGNPQ